MLIFFTEEPAENSCVGSLMENYQEAGHQLVCGSGNLFRSNLAPDVFNRVRQPAKYLFITFEPDNIDGASEVTNRLIRRMGDADFSALSDNWHWLANNSWNSHVNRILGAVATI